MVRYRTVTEDGSLTFSRENSKGEDQCLAQRHLNRTLGCRGINWLLAAEMHPLVSPNNLWHQYDNLIFSLDPLELNVAIKRCHWWSLAFSTRKCLGLQVKQSVSTGQKSLNVADFAKWPYNLSNSNERWHYVIFLGLDETHLVVAAGWF